MLTNILYNQLTMLLSDENDLSDDLVEFKSTRCKLSAKSSTEKLFYYKKKC